MYLNGLDSVPGSFSIPPTEQCPRGYSPIRQGRGVSAIIRCIPKPQPIYTPPPPPPIAAPVFKPTVTVMPTFQQQFTPQFSPTMQQQQDSPGASQAAQPSQEVSTPQVATPTSTVSTNEMIEMREQLDWLKKQSAIPPSGENEATKQLHEELERIKMQNLIRELSVPAQPDTQTTGTRVITAPELQAPQLPTPQDTTGLAIPVGMRTYTEAGISTTPVTLAQEKPKINPWLIGGGILAAALLTV